MGYYGTMGIFSLKNVLNLIVLSLYWFRGGELLVTMAPNAVLGPFSKGSNWP